MDENSKFTVWVGDCFGGYSKAGSGLNGLEAIELDKLESSMADYFTSTIITLDSDDRQPRNEVYREDIRKLYRNVINYQI